MLHLSIKNISSLWFGAHTPIRQFKLKINPKLWTACQKVNLSFNSPSGAVQVDQYQKADKIAFAEAVLKELNQDKILADLNAHRLSQRTQPRISA